MQYIEEEMMDYLEILAKLELQKEEKEEIQAELQKILQYVEQLNELDTSKVEPMTHSVSLENVFRDDKVINENGREALLANAPKQKDGMLKVPKTI